eukprot:CAMPEP_0201881426 /NCGR_PEP_ID=MMETSP0902-20130614/11741_1 /ASSEMBLY_ACC=CAM_ASM_000551 /TAXON_ID=420261 /ORGANISM="Thalassiosira antarctica, Strain CCMP982" /LENGTH=57 /DNA_ID=CAMNT_0048409639 /DNA_START=35 /DNA_END=205 /DNA_ORIENTATION=+
MYSSSEGGAISTGEISAANPPASDVENGEVLAAPARDVELSAYDLPRSTECDVFSGD